MLYIAYIRCIVVQPNLIIQSIYHALVILCYTYMVYYFTFDDSEDIIAWKALRVIGSFCCCEMSKTSCTRFSGHFNCFLASFSSAMFADDEFDELCFSHRLPFMVFFARHLLFAALSFVKIIV